LCNDEKFGSDFAHEETGKDKMRTGVSCARERETRNDDYIVGWG
jgi:hypothetical protein